MEQHTSVKVTVGLFVFVGLLLFAMSIFFLGQRGRYFSTQHSLKAFFTNVGGLHEGATVRLAGVAVGRVTRMQLPHPPEQKVLVELSVAGKAIESVRRDSVARIETLGFMGDKFVEINVGSAQEPRLADGATLQVEEPADVAALVSQGQRVLGHAERVATSLDTLLSPEGGEGALPWLVKNPESKRLVAETLGSVNALAASLAAVSNEVKGGRGLAHALIDDPEGAKLVQESRDLVRNLTEVSQHLNEISEKIARGEGTLGAFLVDPTLYENLTTLLEGTQRSWILRSVIRRTQESGREAQKENAKVGANEK